MKIAVAVCVLAIVSLAHGLSSADIMREIRECKKENNCNENLMRQIKESEIPKTEECQKSLYCTGQHIGMITADNTVNAQVMTQVLKKLHVSADKAAKITEACQSKCTGTDHAAAAKSLMACIQTESKKN